MTDEKNDVPDDEDYIGKTIDLCRKIKDKQVLKIVLGKNTLSSNPEKDFEKLDDDLRMYPIRLEKMFYRIVNLTFAYITSKFISLNLQSASNCESRIKLSVEHLYSTYNVTDDVVRYVILNVALGLDASVSFRKNFNVIEKSKDFYENTHEYIEIFKHIQKLKQSDFKTKENITDSDEKLYKFFKKVSFICDVEIADSTDYVDEESKVTPCRFIAGGRPYDAKYMLVRYFPDNAPERYMLLRSIDEINLKDGGKALKLNYTDIDTNDAGGQTKLFVTEKFTFGERDRAVVTASLGKFYSYITGDLLRKRHRMSFCNGLDSYKYYGELAASVMDALETVAVGENKQLSVVKDYILPVIKNNFNTCQEECVCMGVGCKYDVNRRRCRDKLIRFKENFEAECAVNMDLVSILTILFSVVGCKQILPQIFAKFKFDDPSDFNVLFSEVNEQLHKRFADFDSETVEKRRANFYDKSVSYLSFDFKNADLRVMQILKPLIIRAYTDALVTCLESLDREEAAFNVSPGENVYGIQNKIDLIDGMGVTVKERPALVGAVRSALRDTVKIIIAYYSGLAGCTRQQLNFEIKVEQKTVLDDETAKRCERDIHDAFMDGVDKKLKEIKKDDSFYNLFDIMFRDADGLKSDISIMLGREMVNLFALKNFISLDAENKKCYLVFEKKKDNGKTARYKWDLDDGDDCCESGDEFVKRAGELLSFFKGEDGSKFACYPKVLTHTSSRVNVDKTTINSFTVYESEQYIPQKEYNVITYFSYEISKRYYFVSPKKFEKTRWITYPILIRCSEFYNKVIKGEGEIQ